MRLGSCLVPARLGGRPCSRGAGRKVGLAAGQCQLGSQTTRLSFAWGATKGVATEHGARDGGGIKSPYFPYNAHTHNVAGTRIPCGGLVSSVSSLSTPMGATSDLTWPYLTWPDRVPNGQMTITGHLELENSYLKNRFFMWKDFSSSRSENLPFQHLTWPWPDLWP